MTVLIKIRPATPEDLKPIPEIEITAGQIFRSVGMDAIADDAPPTLKSLERFRKAGHAWVAIAQPPADSSDDSAKIVGYILVHLLDETSVNIPSAHIHQVTVAPDFTRKGVGAKLVKHIELWAKDKSFRELSLTTFRDVPWNAPYYRRLGFRVVSDEELLKEENAALSRLVKDERKVEVLARWPRIAMKKEIDV